MHTHNSDTLLLGQTLAYRADPFAQGLDAVDHHTHGAVLLGQGAIKNVGPRDKLCTAYPDAKIIDYGSMLIMAGFIDVHAHYPQTAIIASWGKRLIDWLETYTFPEEMRFESPEYAKQIATTYYDLILANGTTTAASFCTIHPASVDAFFMEAQNRNMRMVAGKTCMDRNAPDNLRDTAQSAYDDSKSLIHKWHGHDRLTYALSPRFSPTSTPEQLAAMGDLWREHPTCLMQTHLSEQVEEIAWVKKLFPNARDYLETYQHYGLVGRGSIMGHAIYLEDRERALLAETGAAVGHCPTSNTFIGSGLCDVTGLKNQGISLGLGTDIGGGSSFSMLRTMAAAYEIAQLRGQALHPSQLLWLATQGSAHALSLQDKIGNLKAGFEGDVIILDLKSTHAIAQRHANAEGFWQAVFPTIMMGDDRAIHAVWVNGALVEAPQYSAGQ